jgi:hypothetical protein
LLCWGKSEMGRKGREEEEEEEERLYFRSNTHEAPAN